MEEGNTLLKSKLPFPDVEFDRQKKNLLTIISIALIILVIMTILDNLLANSSLSGQKYGIVPYELAWDQKTAEAIITSWGEQGKGYALLNLGFDFLFIASYTAALWQFCRVLSYCLYHTNSFLSKTGTVLAKLVLAAAGLDVFENILLIVMLQSAPSDIMALSVSLAASGKFILIIASLVYVFTGNVAIILNTICGPPIKK